MGGDRGAGPGRKSERPRLPATAPHFNKNRSDMVSYEDLIVTQYLENLKQQRTEPLPREKLQAVQSPYLQRLPHTHLRYGKYRRRPMSATVNHQRPSSGKPKIDAMFIADSNLWDPATPREIRKLRPASAPVRRQRPQSGVSQRSRPFSGRRSIFNSQGHVIKAFAYKNGCKDKFVHVAAPNIKTLLEYVTEKLELRFAARRIFLESGDEVFQAEQIPPEGDIYVSMGENFKDPYQSMRRKMICRASSQWTLTGVVLPDSGRKKKVKTKISKRMRALYENKKVRIAVYRNGSSKESCEVVADLNNIDDFFINCTGKLDLRSHAKIAYDWDGNEIKDLNDTPMLDDTILTQGKTPILGPLWISTGEGFSPTGTLNFLLMIQSVLKDKLKVAKQQKKEIDYALEHQKEKVTEPYILSMTDDELFDGSQKVKDEIDKNKESLGRIKERLAALEDEARKEEEEGMKYRMSHIQELGAEDRLVGTKGIKLKVFENGRADGEFLYYFNLREAMKGVDNNNIKAMVLRRLLDELSYTRFSAGANRNLKASATNLYNKNGTEIKDVTTLQPEQQVWISFGEPWICPFTYSLHLFLDKAAPVTDENGAQRIVREAIVGPEMEALVKDTSRWEASIGFPALYDSSEFVEPGKLDNSEIDSKAHYLLLKDTHNIALYAEVGVTEKFHCKSQIFVYNEAGYIYCKAAPQLCLSVMDQRMEAKIINKDCTVNGITVGLQKRMVGNPSQMWKCLPDATICSAAYPDLLLTYLGNKKGDESDEDYAEYFKDRLTTGGLVFLVVAEALPKKDMAAQRFAFKQEKFENLGQWKFTDSNNQEWHKLAYSWPVRQNGELNKDYDWPMEGYILPNAPPIRKAGKKSSLSGMTPVRLRVLKNGERGVDSAISVVGPNLTNMLKENAKKEQANKTKKNNNKQMVAQTNGYEEVDMDLHCMDMTVAEVEFQMFLAHCTGLLDLPFAARRLFDSQGKELFSIQNLERDTLVYASTGEEWSDPRVNKKEQKRRFLLSQLTSDVVKIQQYCAMRNPENYILEINGPLEQGTGLVVRCRDEEPTHHSRGDASSTHRSMEGLQKSVDGDEEDLLQAEQDPSNLTAHQRAHRASEERANTLKWPWERLVNVNNSMDTTDPEANKYTDRDLYEKFKPHSTIRVPRDALQKFEFEDGYISVHSNRGLVLAVSESEGRVVDVILAKRRPDDINQRWVITENGEILARINKHFVLTVSMPATASDNQALSFNGCPVTLQTRITNQFGTAHQRWRYDAETGFINAFAADPHNKEITAANKADVCTYAIAQVADIDQPGYVVEINNHRGDGPQKHKVCMSCARAMRGRYKVQKLPPNTNFHCAMGDAKKLGIRQVGSFKVLNNKADLSTFEAELTLKNWLEILPNLRKETSVQTITKEINAAKTVRTVKVMAYKNGEGRLRKGEIICGSSIEGILGQCAHRLGLNSAARRMYLEDGELVLDIDELVRYAVENCKSEMINMILMQKAEEAGKKDNREEEELQEEENEAARLERLQAMASDEINQSMKRSLDRVMGRGDGLKLEKSGGGRGRGTEEDEDEEEEDSQRQDEDESSMQKDLDREEAEKIRREREQLLENVKLPPLDNILRAPIEVWVSSNKAFVSPEVVESKEDNRRKKRQFRAQVCLALDIDKHVLRQMKGRRLEQMKPGVYKSTLSSKQPVIVEKHWQEPTVEEQDKHHSVHKLQTHLGEIRANQQEGNPRFAGINLEGKLYRQPDMKRIQVYPNGETLERSVYIWGSSIQELLDNATQKLGLWKPARILYELDGQRINDFEDIQRDQLLCVSTGKSFMQSANQSVQIEVKANWGRARKKYGPKVTDVVVEVEKNPGVDVDPFGPPQLALGDGPTKQQINK